MRCGKCLPPVRFRGETSDIFSVQIWKEGCENYVALRLKLKVNCISEISKPGFLVISQNINASRGVLTFVYIRSNFLKARDPVLNFAYKINGYSNIRFPPYSSRKKAWKLNVEGYNFCLAVDWLRVCSGRIKAELVQHIHTWIEAEFYTSPWFRLHKY